MKVNKLYGVEGAMNSRGLVVIVDVFRAATLEACALYKETKYVIPVSSKDEAFYLKRKNPDFLIAGEKDGYKIEGFDFGNSPFTILSQNLKGKVLVHRSTEGTQGLVNAKNADELIFGSFVTLSATRRYIQKVNPDTLSIVSMSGRGTEDDQYAQFLEEEIKRKNPDLKKVKEFMKLSKGTKKYFDPNEPQFPIEDFDICLDLDRFDFFCKVEKKNGRLTTTKGVTVL